MVRVVLGPTAASVAGTATTAGASRTIDAVVLVLVLRPLVASATLALEMFIADVSTRVAEVPLSLMHILLLRRMIAHLIMLAALRVLPMLLARLAPCRVLLNVLTAALDGHFGDVTLARLLVLGVVTDMGHTLGRVYFSAGR